MLACVETLDRVQPSLYALPHVVRSIEAFLDHSYRWSLESAAASCHLHLMDRLVRHKPVKEDWFRLSRFYYGTSNAAKAGSVDVLAWWMTEYLPGEQPSYNLMARDAAFLGHVCILEWLKSKGFFPDGLKSMATNQPNVVKWMHAKPELKVRLSVCMNTAAEIGNLEFMKWLQEHQSELDVGCTGDALVAANERGDLEMIQWLLANRPELVQDADEWLSKSYRVARYRPAVSRERPNQSPHLTCPGGHSDLLNTLKFCDGSLSVFRWLKTEYQWTNQLYAERWAQNVAMHAAACNNFLMIKILKERQWLGASYTFQNPLRVAARNGHLEMVQWIFNLDSQCHKEAMKGAASRGHLHILQWLQEKKPVDSLDEAMDLAAFGGHLKVLQWMHQARSSDGNHESFLCTSQAMNVAAARGHMDVVKWLNESRAEGCTSAALRDAAANGHLDVVKYIYVHWPEHCSPMVMDGAATNGHLEILKFLHSHHPRGWTSNGTTASASNGHMETVRWLYEKWPHVWRKNAIDEAARNGHVEVVQFLMLQCHFRCRTRGRTDAKHRGHFAVLEWLQSHELGHEM